MMHAKYLLFLRSLAMTLCIMAFVGCVTTSPETRDLVWNEGRVDLPEAISSNSDCRSGWIKNLAENCSAASVPAVVFLHGCAGQNGRQLFHIRMFTELGYTVFSPDSFARPNRGRSCGRANSVMHLRREEIEIALSRISTFDWVDSGKLVLAGFSEGGIATSTYGGSAFKGIVGMGFGCSSRSFHAPNNIPVLQINGSYDKEISDTRLCSGMGRDNFEALYVDTGHPVNSDPVTQEKIGAFLNQVIGFSD